MKPIEIIKIFGYIFVLMACFVVLKGLSTFEYELRDQTVTYEEVWKANFAEALDTLDWSYNPEACRLDEDQLIFSLPDTLDRVVLRFKKNFEVDTGYLQLNVVTPPASIIHSEVSVKVNDSRLELFPPHEIRSDQSLRTPLFKSDEMVTLKVVLRKTKVSNQDTLSLNGDDLNMYISGLKFFKQNRPEKLF